MFIKIAGHVVNVSRIDQITPTGAVCIGPHAIHVEDAEELAALRQALTQLFAFDFPRGNAPALDTSENVSGFSYPIPDTGVGEGGAELAGEPSEGEDGDEGR